jgi:hypothetical protein
MGLGFRSESGEPWNQPRKPRCSHWGGAPGETAAGDAIGRLVEEQEEYHREIAERVSGRLREAGLTAEARMALGDPRAALLDAARSELRMAITP